ncbi:MAG: 2-vinyl bacteriochlorophyllide hydratase [Gammaproteobacteria bacterium]|nr:2-vinyl bacteriochlorophyllide hydratase [Gammaproteobacteria bacterium]MDE2348582.1 2-vinyl bacteriochlorophyllide hydratase [Gammaproteobacteria bacterium]
MSLYTAEERQRRDSTRWTLVQGILAPIQFLVFLVSATLVLRFLLTGRGYSAASMSVLVKTVVLYAIMGTGCLWERAVFGRYLFAAAFFWEDVVSMFVVALHSLYVVALFFGALHARYQMYIALLAYAAYMLNATQFLLKLRAARRQEAVEMTRHPLSGRLGGRSPERLAAGGAL